MKGYCNNQFFALLLGCLFLVVKVSSFTTGPVPSFTSPHLLQQTTPPQLQTLPQHRQQQDGPRKQQSKPLQAAVPDLDVVALVAGQENYGLAVVCVGEALWSFFQAPSFDHAKILVPAAAAALVLVAVSGPMITSGDAASVGTGLWIATGVSVGLGVSYAARLAAPFSPSAKEIAALGLLVAVAGFFSFSQNLVVDGFVTLPSINLPKLPSIELPSFDDVSLPTIDDQTPSEAVSAPLEGASTPAADMPVITNPAE